MRWWLRPAAAGDVEAIAELRALVMRPDLERLGRWDEHRVRQRFRDSFAAFAEYTSVIEVSSQLAGSVTLRPAPTGRWLENFYLAPHLQGRGLGSSVLRSLLTSSDTPVALKVLQGSPARRLYERHGFVVESEDPIDVLMVRGLPI